MGSHVSRWPSLLVVFTLLLPAGLLPGADAHAQVKWVWVDALGYAGAGTALGVMANWDSDLDDFDRVMVTTFALAGAGAIVGGRLIGGAADRALERGETLGLGHRALVVSGSIMAGATAGALASAALINGEGEGTAFGSDETTFTLMATGGAALGGLFAWWRRGDLRPRGVTVAPSVDPMGGAGVVVRYRF